MENAQGTLLRAGGKDQLLADFTALSEATTLEGLPKYAERPTLDNLAKILTAQSGGPNKDMALFELSHLVYGVAGLLGSHAISDFFLSPEKAVPARFRNLLEEGETGNGISLEDESLRLSYGDKTFDIRYGRMPVLAALYEFLCAMESFSHYQIIADLFDELMAGPLDDKTLRQCSNALASLLRKYRIAHLTTAEADGKFIQVYKFLQEKSAQNTIIVEDDSVLDFWTLHNKGKDYKGYRTVFDLFCDFTKAFEEAERVKASSSALRLGTNMEEEEFDIAEGDVDASHAEDWVSPFDVFNEEEFSEIRFFKKKTERGPIENLMEYGPDALRLPLAFIRYETFGQVQSGITNDLQVGRGKDSVQRRMTCQDVQSYEERLDQCQEILSHIKTLQASSLHVLNDDNVVAFPANAQEAAQKAFSKMNRKGFDAQAGDKKAAFSKAAGALIQMERQLDRYMEGLRRKGAVTRFPEDVQSFQTQFSQLYEEALS